MTTTTLYTRVFPVLGILYVIALIATHGNGTVAVIGALTFAVLGVGARFMLPAGTRDRDRQRNRERDRDR